jgi:hypothetical protein
MVGVTAWATLAGAAPCPVGATDDPFRSAPTAARVRVVVEVWPAGAPDGWAESVLDALDRNGVSAVVVLPVGTDPAAWGALLARVGATDHDLGVWLPEASTPTVASELRTLQAQVRPLADAAGERPRTAVATVGRGSVESLLGRAGYRVLLDAAGTSADTPRPAAHFDGRPPTGVVLPPGPWDGDAPPRCAPFRPADADRLARTLERAQRAPGVPVVRWSLVGRGGDPADAVVLDRWLREVGAKSGAAFGTATQARAAVMDGDGGAPPPPAGRSVDAAAVEAAAAALREGDVLPRALPGGLSPTDAFLAFAVRLTGAEDAFLQIPIATGPAQSATGSADPGAPIDRAALVAWAKALLAAPPPELPSAARLGDRVYPARELLVALASAVRGDDPVTTRAVTDPDPNARGLGWGGGP